MQNQGNAKRPSLSSLPTLSADELACVAGGGDPTLKVEDGKEQYPASIGSLSYLRKGGHHKKH
jgi:hypothetical protein